MRGERRSERRLPRALECTARLLVLGALAGSQAACLGEYLSMAVGGDGYGLISYADTDQGVLKVAHCEDAACSTASVRVVDANGRAVGWYTSIARGADGLGLISYVEGTGTLRVAHCEDAACASARVTVLDTERYASYTSIAIGRDGHGLVSYRNHANGDLLVAHCEDVACTRATLAVVDDGTPKVPHVGGYVGARAGVAIGPDGLGLISYQDQPVGNLKLAHCADTACSRADSIAIADRGGIKGTGGGSTSLAITAAGIGMVAYHGSTAVNLLQQDLRLARCHDPLCASATASALDHRASADVGNYASLVIGPDGAGLIGYQDGGGGGSPAAVKVARCLDLTCSRIAVSLIDSAPE